MGARGGLVARSLRGAAAPERELALPGFREPPDAREAISASLEERFAFLIRQLKVNNTAATIARWVKAPDLPIDKDREIVAAGGQITTAERKADGLAD